MRLWMMAAALGIIFVQLLPGLPLPGVYYLLPLCCAALLYGLRFRHRCLWLFAVFMLGLLWGCYGSSQALREILPRSFEGEDLQVSGTIVELPQTHWQHGAVNQRFVLAVDGAVCASVSPSRCYSYLSFIKLSWLKSEALRSGDYWQLTVRLKRPRGYANPGGFDYQRWLLQQRIGATGYVKSAAGKLATDTAHKPLRAMIDYQRWRFSGLLDRQLADLKQLPIIKAILIADRRGISREQWDLFIDTGVIHLMVISGLHIGLVAGVTFYLLRLVTLVCLPMLAAERVAAVFAWLAALAYCLAAGFSLPTQRALVMVSVWLVALFFARNLSPASGLVISLLLCLVIDPLSPLSQSFWLSFIAVTVIFIGLTGRRKRGRQWALLLAPQWVVFVGMLPLIAVVQGVLNLLSLPANSVLVPLFGFVVVPLAFAASLCLLIDASLSQPLWLLLDWCLTLASQYLQHLVGFLAWFPAPMITAPPWWLLLLAALGTLVLLLPRGLPNKHLGWLLLLPLLIYRPAAPDYGGVRVSALDVGQGLSIVVQTHKHALVYDLGPQLGEDFDTASRVVRPYLLHQGIHHVDRLVISHADNDHAGAWQFFMQAHSVGQIILGEALPGLLMDDPASHCANIPAWQWDGVNFEFITAQLTERELNGNNRSCVLRITAAETVFLLTGDIERLVELQLVLQQRDKLPSAVLFAPHHGSNSSSTWPFIKVVRPQHVVFSSGYRNQFGHPAPAVVARYQALGSELHYNSRAGTVVFEVSSAQWLSWSHFRAGQRYYWQ